VERADYVLDVLTRCRHNGFPVVRGGGGGGAGAADIDAHGCGASRGGPLQGLILRSQILVMLRHQARGLASLFRVMCNVNLINTHIHLYSCCAAASLRTLVVHGHVDSVYDMQSTVPGQFVNKFPPAWP